MNIIMFGDSIQNLKVEKKKDFLENSLYGGLIGSADGPPLPLNCIPIATGMAGKLSVLNGFSSAFLSSQVFLMSASNCRSFSSGAFNDPCPGQETGSAVAASITLATTFLKKNQDQSISAS